MCWRSAADRTAPRSLGRTRRGVRGLAEDRRPLPAVLNGNRRLDLRDQSAQLLDLTRAEPGGIVHSRRLTYGTFECGNPILAVSGPSPIATRRRRKSSMQAVNKPPLIASRIAADGRGRRHVVQTVREESVRDGVASRRRGEGPSNRSGSVTAGSWPASSCTCRFCPARCACRCWPDCGGPGTPGRSPTPASWPS